MRPVCAGPVRFGLGAAGAAAAAHPMDFPEMTLSNWKIEKGRIALKGWFSAMLKLQQRNAEAIENGAGSITTECKGFDFSITLGDDFKIATDKETQKEIIEIKLQGS